MGPTDTQNQSSPKNAAAVTTAITKLENTAFVTVLLTICLAGLLAFLYTAQYNSEKELSELREENKNLAKKLEEVQAQTTATSQNDSR